GGGLGPNLRAVAGRGTSDHAACLALLMDSPVGAAESLRREQGRILRGVARRRPLRLAVNVSLCISEVAYERLLDWHAPRRDRGFPTPSHPSPHEKPLSVLAYHTPPFNWKFRLFSILQRWGYFECIGV